jgi:hypothetical protein
MRIVFLLLLFLPCNGKSQIADSAQLKEYVRVLTRFENPRNYKILAELNSVADFIYSMFNGYADTTWMQRYTVNGVEYKNVICSFGTNNKERIIVGAHYDVCGNQSGADDNASGVAGLLELCHMLIHEKPKYRIDLVAYTLEEPPFFRTESMGSYVHAKYLHDNNVPVKGMISLEMIGYFSDKKKSQDYPLGILRMFYGNRGNYITVVQKFGNGKFGRRTKRLMKHQRLVKTKSFKGPKALPGIVFSDHLNYWKFCYRAVMITDTAFYRNKNYHEKGDTPEILDYKRMGLVVEEVFKTITGY